MTKCMKLKSKILFTLLVLMSVSVTSCLDPEIDDPMARLNQEVNAIDYYLSSTAATNVIKDFSGIRIDIETMGKGLPARVSSAIDIDYVGRFFDPISGGGAIFEQGNVDPTDQFTHGILSNYIQGWQIALTRIPPGTIAKIYIPSYWGYGAKDKKDNQGHTVIPANSTLVFDIRFNDVILSTAEVNQFKADTTALENYLETKAVTNYQTDSLGVRYVISELGSGSEPGMYHRVKFNYKVFLLTNDLTPAAQGTFEPGPQVQSRLCDYLQGFAIGLSKIRPGGKIRAYVPSLYCFGPTGLKSGGTNIPVNAPLIIDLELITSDTQ